MRWILKMIAALLILIISGMGQPTTYPYYDDYYYGGTGSPGVPTPPTTYPPAYPTTGTQSGTTSGGAPTPSTPTSPEALGLQTPSVTQGQTPPPQESSQELMLADESTAVSRSSATTQRLGSSYYRLIIPPGRGSPNRFYVSYRPQTVAGCYLGQSLPLWLDVSRSGPIWAYEWYPDGHLDTQYLGYVNPGWHKRWFYADTPGWHILQYYCNGWSNYVYIYVYGRTTPTPPTPTPPTPRPPGQCTSDVTIRSSWFQGYNVYLDGVYKGTEGTGGDARDGIYRMTVPGNQYHRFTISRGGQSYSEYGTFLCGYSYRFTI